MSDPAGAPKRAPLSRELGCAARAIEALIAGRSLPGALDAALAAEARQAPLPEASRAAIRDIAYGACRRLGLVRELAERLNARAPAPEVAALQCVALSELVEPLRADGIIVDQAVAAARRLSGGLAIGGFVNATLRRFVRERQALLEAARTRPQARWNFPDWWIRQLRQEHPEHWQGILEVGNTMPPMTLRVNRRRGTVAGYLALLADAGRRARQVGPDALVLESACAVEALPGWQDGLVSVQDAGAQLAAHFLKPLDSERILDACAAPGGKTTHLLERADCAVTALDVGPERLRPVRENLARLGFPVVESVPAVVEPRVAAVAAPGVPAVGPAATVLAGDARSPADWWDGMPFDRILVDAPCTASGIVRRHPDIRWLRRRSDLATLARRQAEIVSALWPLLRPGGKLLYTTCSVFRAEGESVIDHFRDTHRDAQRLPLRWSFHPAREEPVSLLLPTTSPTRDHDGFFYALLEKSH